MLISIISDTYVRNCNKYYILFRKNYKIILCKPRPAADAWDGVVNDTFSGGASDIQTNSLRTLYDTVNAVIHDLKSGTLHTGRMGLDHAGALKLTKRIHHHAPGDARILSYFFSDKDALLFVKLA